MITKRQNELIKALKNSPVLVTASSLSRSLGVSSKTIRNDITKINTAFQSPVIESKAGAGYFICDPQNFLKDVDSTLETENLRFELLNRILEREAINFYDLADAFFISESTLSRIIQELNQVIAEKDESLCIVRRQNQLLVEGEEEQKRAIFNLFLNQEIKTHKLSLDKYSDYFEHCDLTVLSNLVIDHHNEIDFYMNDFSMISFIIHVAVLIERVSQGSYIETLQVKKIDKKSQQLAQQFIVKLENSLGIIIPKKELYYVARLYSGKFVMMDELAEEGFLSLTDRIIQIIDENFMIDFSADERMKDYLSTHLSALYRRAVKKQYLSNPLTEELKNKYPFIYNVSVLAADAIQKELNITFPDDEIAYIALHFLSASETMSHGKLKRILLVSPYGVASRRLVHNKLRKLNFTIDLIEATTVFDVQNYLDNELDLIITTENVTVSSNIPVYFYSAIFDDSDVSRVESILKEQDESKEIIHHFFKEELFFVNQNFKNREEVITFLCQQLTDQGYCEPNYVEKVLDREQLSCTSYENYYAIPHAIQRTALQNAVAVCCLEKPIKWGGNRVRLVLLLAMKKERDHAFEELFGFLVKILDEGSFVKKLSKQTNFYDFIELCK
ncbi:BglG family transcription antiterminator [Enterococcus alishanensis]|uniref:BglG family transcription antiterminator n=1 Tax=Enterococcus alishanensis TaxID=1303817 RepID=A0ABS6T907_9ENTE|nr:BglG family transcription antiterminator [Enterococcus alishanensis]